MEVMVVDPSRSYAWLYAHPPGSTSSTMVGPANIMSVWPELIAQIETGQKVNRVVRAALSVTAAEAITGITVIREGAVALPDTDDLFYELQLPVQRVATKQFTKRQREGEVIVNPYARGTLSQLRDWAPDLSKKTEEIQLSYYRGWYTCDFEGSSSGFPAPAPSPKEFVPDGWVCGQAACILVYKKFVIPDDAYLLSPLVQVSGYPHWDYDTDLVTSVLADRNNGTLDLLTEMIEFPETLAFATDLVKRATFMTCDLEMESRSMKRKLSKSQYARWLANHWLKGRYALMPIFYTLMDVSKVLKEMGQEYAEYKRTVTKSVPLPYTHDGLISDEQDIKHRCFIKSRYTPDSLMADLRRLININLATTAWEATTFSFVADWVFNFGDYISAVTGSDGSEQSACCYSVRHNAEWNVTYDTEDAALLSLKTKVKINAYQRATINPYDQIGLSTRFDMNWKRYFDAAALSLRPALKHLRSLK